MGKDCFEILDRSGDVALALRGESIAEIISCATQAYLELLTEGRSVEPVIEKTVEVRQGEEGGVGETVVRWLNELIFLTDAESFLPCTATLRASAPGLLRFSVRGDFFDSNRHEQRLLVKAATYHGLSVRRIGSAFEVQVLLDL